VKKILCITFLLALLSVWYSAGFPLEKWHEGIITDKTESTITANKKAYNINSSTVIKDKHDNPLPLDALGQESCCNHIKFLVTDGGYVKEIIVDTDKALR